MDSMVRTSLAIGREIDDARSILDTGTGDKRNEGQPSSSLGKKQRSFVPRGFSGDTLSPSHQWDTVRHSMFLLTVAWARGTDISPRVQHGHQLFRIWAREARAWVEVEGKDHRSGLRGPRGMFTPLHHRRSPQIRQLYRVCFYSRAYGQEYCLILVHLILLLLHLV